MHINLISNIKKSLKVMTDEDRRDQTYKEYLAKIGMVGDCPNEGFHVTEREPRFYKDSNLCSPQQDFFGFYALRNAIRGCLVSCRFIEGGNLLNTSGYYALSTIAYYSAAFQLLTSFLAINGKTIVQYPVNSLINTPSKLPEQICAKLTRNNRWNFEGLGLSHKQIWSLLACVFAESYKDSIPSFFIDFLKYIAKLNNKTFEPTNLKEIIESVPNLRHQALYAGFGFDRIEYENAMTRSTSRDSEINKLSCSLQSFSQDLLSYCLEEVLLIQAAIDSCPGFTCVYYLLRAGIGFPPFEFETRTPMNLDRDDLSKRMRKLMYWINF